VIAAVVDAAGGIAAVVDAAVGSAAVVDAAVGSAAVVDAAVGIAAVVDAAVGSAAVVDAAVGIAAVVDAAVGSVAVVDAVVGSAAVGDVKEAAVLFALGVVAEAEDVVAVYLFEEGHVAVHIDSHVGGKPVAAFASWNYPKEAVVAAVVVGSLEAVVSPLDGD